MINSKRNYIIKGEKKAICIVKENSEVNYPEFLLPLLRSKFGGIPAKKYLIIRI